MIKNAENEQLQKGLTDHLGETESHVDRLETIFEQLDMAPKKLKVEAIRGLIDDASWCMEQDTTSATLDSMIIASASYIEHYEIAGYTSLLAWAELLGLDDAQALIQQTLDEETNADATLAEAAEEVNEEANVTLEDEEEEDEEV